MTARNVLLIDGRCVYCNRLASWVTRHDPRQLFHFAHIQGQFGQAAIARHQGNPADLDAVYVVVDVGTPHERLLVDGQAGRFIWPKFFRAAVILRFVPLFILNPGYRLFARYRFRMFGMYDQCESPADAVRARFID